jgi:hypothetical protein
VPRRRRGRQAVLWTTFSCPKPSSKAYLGKGGKCRGVSAACFPSRCIPPCSRRSLARRHGMMARTNDAGSCGCSGATSGLVLASCPWHSRTQHRDRPAARAVAGVAPVPAAARSRPAAPPKCGSRHAPLWPMQCAHWGSFHAPQTSPRPQGEVGSPFKATHQCHCLRIFPFERVNDFVNKIG